VTEEMGRLIAGLLTGRCNEERGKEVADARGIPNENQEWEGPASRPVWVGDTQLRLTGVACKECTEFLSTVLTTKY